MAWHARSGFCVLSQNPHGQELRKSRASGQDTDTFHRQLNGVTEVNWSAEPGVTLGLGQVFFVAVTLRNMPRTFFALLLRYVLRLLSAAFALGVSYVGSVLLYVFLLYIVGITGTVFIGV